MVGDAAGELSPDDMKDFTAALHRYSDVVERQLQVERTPAGSSNRNDVRVEQGRDPLWLALCATVLCVAFSFSAQQRLTDMRIDMQTERVSREVTTKWTAQEVTAIRSYITTGKLAPMTPPPVAVPPAKEK